MTRPLRIEYPGAVYHITTRGNARHDIFDREGDYEQFLSLLAKGVGRYTVHLYAYVLMANHVHLLVCTPRGNLSRFMQYVIGSYTQRYNREHGRCGHLFSGRFQAKLVERDRYLLNLTRYLHLNPVKVKGIKGRSLLEKIQYLRAYPWSSYRSYVGLELPKGFVEYGLLSLQIGQYRKGGVGRAYAEYVESGLARKDEELGEALKISSKAVGDQGFQQWVEKEHRELTSRSNQPSGIARRRVEAGVAAEVIIEKVVQEFGVLPEELQRKRSYLPVRSWIMKLLAEVGGLTQEEIAPHVGLRSGSAVSHSIQKWNEQIEADKTLANQYHRLMRMF